MSTLPQLSFLPPEYYDGSMVVEELSLGHENEQPIAPFKGSKFVVFPNETSPLDQHDVIECWFIAAGTGEVIYNGEKKAIVKTGDVLYFESQQSHQVYNNGSENLLIFSVWWKK